MTNPRIQRPIDSPAAPRARACAPRRPAGRSAFTLLELLLVVMLVGVLAYFAWPDFTGQSRREQLVESERRMKALVAMCRAEAMNQARQYRITFRTDGRVDVTRQRDPLVAPHEFVAILEDWANTRFLLDGVWVAALQPLRDGPAPILIEDDNIEFTELEDDPTDIAEIEASYELTFQPDGQSSSMRWVLRDTGGHGVLMTLDGRLGRVESAEAADIPEGEAQAPELQADETKPPQS